MKKKLSEYERFMSLSDKEKDREVAKYDREMSLDELRPLTAADKVVHARAHRKGGRPRVGRGAKPVLVTMERSLLERTDRFAKAHSLSRAQLIARGLEVVLTLNELDNRIGLVPQSRKRLSA